MDTDSKVNYNDDELLYVFINDINNNLVSDDDGAA